MILKMPETHPEALEVFKHQPEPSTQDRPFEQRRIMTDRILMHAETHFSTDQLRLYHCTLVPQITN